MTDHPVSIGRYRILRTLGTGGMGVVYAAFDDQLEREIAVKTIALGAGGDQSHERFLREARASAGLNHPNVCQVYEVGEENGRGFWRWSFSRAKRSPRGLDADRWSPVRR